MIWTVVMKQSFTASAMAKKSQCSKYLCQHKPSIDWLREKILLSDYICVVLGTDRRAKRSSRRAKHVCGFALLQNLITGAKKRKTLFMHLICSRHHQGKKIMRKVEEHAVQLGCDLVQFKALPDSIECAAWGERCAQPVAQGICRASHGGVLGRVQRTQGTLDPP